MSTRGWIASILAAISGSICIACGVYTLWAQNTGEYVPVTVLECHQAGRAQTCTGQWWDRTGAHKVAIVSEGYPRAGEVSTMRIHGAKAYSTSPMLPTILIGAGAALLGGAIYAFHIARRRASIQQLDTEDGES